MRSDRHAVVGEQLHEQPAVRGRAARRGAGTPEQLSDGCRPSSEPSVVAAHRRLAQSDIGTPGHDASRVAGRSRPGPRRRADGRLDNRTDVRYASAAKGGAGDQARRRTQADASSTTSRRRCAPAAIRPPCARSPRRSGLASTSAVHHHLEALERDGYLERGATRSRALRLTPTAALHAGLTSELLPQVAAMDSHLLPVIGEIAAGGPIEAYQDASETLAVPDFLAPSGDAYVLRVRGDSMIDAHIADGDFVVIRPQETARNGDIVVAQVEENAVTLKRFFKEGGRVRLQPANSRYPPHVLRRRADPGQADRGHPPARLTASSTARRPVIHNPSTALHCRNRIFGETGRRQPPMAVPDGAHHRPAATHHRGPPPASSMEPSCPSTACRRNPSTPSSPCLAPCSSTATPSSRSPTSSAQTTSIAATTARSTRAILDLYERREPIDIVTVSEVLEREGALEQVGGAGLPDQPHQPHANGRQRRLVRPHRRAEGGPAEPDRGRRARSPASATRTARMSRRPSTGRSRSCSRSARSGSETGFSPLRTLLHAAYDRLDYLHEHRGEISGVRTGFRDLDALTTGLQKSDLVIVAARPSRRQDEPGAQHRRVRRGH